MCVPTLTSLGELKLTTVGAVEKWIPASAGMTFLFVIAKTGMFDAFEHLNLEFIWNLDIGIWDLPNLYWLGLELEVKLGVWIREDGRHVYGDGRQALLEEVDKFGSISRAAEEMGMSYRAAWGKIKATEAGLGIKLLSRKVGGFGGGGAVLTDEARSLMTAYARFRDGLDELVNERWLRTLKGNGQV